MYERYFGMIRTPFVRNVPAGQLYEPEYVSDILGRLGYAADRQLFLVMTGDPGCGKSTIIRKFAESLPKEYLLIYLSDSKLSPSWLYKGMLEQLGLDPKFYRSEARRQLHTELAILRGVKGQKVIVVLDEAHLLCRDTLQEFRFLLNFSYDSTSPMTLILSGQTELLDTIRRRPYDALRQRIDMFCSVPHMDRSETEAYIHSHLRYAGCDRELYTDTAVDEIYRFSGGIARMVNRICEKSLMYAFQQGKKLVDDHMIRYVAEHEMQYETAGGGNV